MLLPSQEDWETVVSGGIVLVAATCFLLASSFVISSVCLCVSVQWECDCKHAGVKADP